MGNLNPLPAKSSAAKAYNLFGLVTFTIGAKVANVINVGVQLKDARGQAIGQAAKVQIHLSSDPSGSPITPTVPTSTLAIGTNGAIISVDTADKALTLLSSATGRFDLNITQTASPVPYYLVVEMPDGSISVSPIISF